jgi:hypothetical protein
MMVWSYEKIKEQFIPRLEEKLKSVPAENIITPEPSIAVPVIEALRYTGHNDELRELFSSLLAAAMNSDTAFKAHPSFVELIKQINSDEAKIIKLFSDDLAKPLLKIRLYDINSPLNAYAEPLINFSNLPYEANCTFPELGPSYIENLERLGLINISYTVYNTLPNAYDFIENHPIVTNWKDLADQSTVKRFEINRGAVTLTSFGKKFLESCVF